MGYVPPPPRPLSDLTLDTRNGLSFIHCAPFKIVELGEGLRLLLNDQIALEDGFQRKSNLYCVEYIPTLESKPIVFASGEDAVKAFALFLRFFAEGRAANGEEYSYVPPNDTLLRATINADGITITGGKEHRSASIKNVVAISLALQNAIKKASGDENAASRPSKGKQ